MLLTLDDIKYAILERDGHITIIPKRSEKAQLSSIFHHRSGEEKRRALARFGFDPNAPAMALDDFLAHCEANAGARIILLRV